MEVRQMAGKKLVRQLFDEHKSNYESKYKSYKDQQIKEYCKEQDTEKEDLDEYELQQIDFRASKKFWDTYKKSLKKFTDYGHDNYKTHQQYPYNLNWLCDNLTIKYNWDLKKRERVLVPDVLNYLWTYDDRKLKGNESFAYMEFVTSIPSEKRVYGEKKHLLSMFITNKHFWKRIVQETGWSKEYINKCFKALCQVGILKVVENRGKMGTAYADGYYTEYRNARGRKRAFLTKKKHETFLEVFDGYTYKEEDNVGSF